MLEISTTMPPQYREHTIGDMAIGEIAWTLPWAMVVDYAGTGRLNARYPAGATAEGTRSMRVGRVPQGYVVEIPRDYTYQPQVHSAWAELPVVAFVSEQCGGRLAEGLKKAMREATDIGEEG